MTILQTQVDELKWPDVAGVPRARLRAGVANALVKRVAGRLPFQVELPSRRRYGTHGPTLYVKRPKAFFRRLGKDGLIGFGEAYQAGDWESDDLVGLLSALAANVTSVVPRRLQWLRHLHGARFPKEEFNTLEGARRNIHRHYDLSNDLFGLFLDETMTYSAALFRTGEESLVQAQHAKIDRLLDRAGVGAGTRVLEIGTGWGELAIRAAARGATVRSVTISAEQQRLAQRRARAAGVDVEIDLCDYRNIEGSHCYDAIVSVEMIEAVGERYWPAYFSTLERLLAPGGKVGIQAITMAHERMRATRSTYTWIHKYIFPGGLIPSVQSIVDNTSLQITDDFAFGQDYARTLRTWRETFLARTREVEHLGFDGTFRRTWEFYLAYSEAGFRTGYLNVRQLILEAA